jgi:hypothetical protein
MFTNGETRSTEKMRKELFIEYKPDSLLSKIGIESPTLTLILFFIFFISVNK